MRRASTCTALLAGLGILIAVPGLGQPPGTGAPAVIPPRVVAVDPPGHAVNVDPNLREIRVTFDRPMATEKAWSWMALANQGLYPADRGGAEPRFDATGRTCILPVALEPNAVYAAGVNGPAHTGFRDQAGTPALAFGWAFATGGYQAEELPPRVVRASPEPGAVDVDPALKEISVTFDRPMRRETWSWVLQPGRGEYPGARAGSPRFSPDGLTCFLPVELKPGTHYALSANSDRHSGFKSRAGSVCLPFAWAFKTRGAGASANGAAGAPGGVPLAAAGADPR